ncbi:MAG: PEP-CTERM sorting domain-containing protein [Crocosphaera sp.]
MINKIAKRLLFPGVTVAVLGAVPAQAAVFNFTYTDTVSNNNGVDNVSVGDTAVITYELDNGGTSLINQTWTDSDIVSVTFDFGNGAHITTFDPNGGDGLIFSTGSFTTDGAGQLTAVPSSWADADTVAGTVNVISTNSSQTPSGWVVAGGNSVYATDIGLASLATVSLANVSGNIVASNWTVEAAEVPSTPEPGTILGLLAVGSITALTRKRKG